VVLAGQGRVAKARSVLDRLRDPGDISDGARYWCYAQLELLLAERQLERAVVLADAFERRFARITNPVDTPWRTHRAAALDGLGRREQALADAARALSDARQWGAPGMLARAPRVLGTLQGEPGIERVHDAVTVAAETPARLEHAKALVALGHTLRAPATTGGPAHRCAMRWRSASATARSRW